MKNEIIPIFFTIDNNYAPFLAVAIRSAIKKSNPENRYKAIVLHNDVSDENIKRITALATENFEVEFIPMRDGLESITDSMSNRLRCDYFTLSIYFRLFIPSMFPQYDKGIYIDSDVVLNGDIAELYNIDIGDNYIGACADLSIVDVPPLVRYTEEAVGMEKGKYINSGVLLMNMKKLREVKLDEHFLSLLNTYHFDCIAPDQDYLNAMCSDNIHYLDECWDAMPNDSRPPLEKPMLVHYNLFSKPWCYDGIQYGELFWVHAKESGYLAEILEYKNNYSDEQKESDSKCMGLLASRGEKICGDEVTFNKIFESGIKVRL